MTARFVWFRLAQVVPAVAAIVLVGFVLVHLAPGDPVLALAGESGDAEYYAFMREKFGLDRSLPQQLASYTANMLQGDLGVSYVHGRPVAELILERLPATLLLTGSALALSSVTGIAVGAFAGSRRGGPLDVSVNVTTLAMYAAPVFWLGQLAILGLALHAGLFPVQGMSSATSDGRGLDHVFDVLHHLALPAVVLASQEIAAVARLTRAGVVEELQLDYVRTARSKGLSEGRVVVAHALRRALIPVVTVIGGRVGHLLAGAVVIEFVFGWPGIGRLLLTAVQNRDTPIVLGIFMLVAFTVVIANLLTDLVYGWLDPRIRYR